MSQTCVIRNDVKTNVNIVYVQYSLIINMMHIAYSIKHRVFLNNPITGKNVLSFTPWTIDKRVN